MRYELKEKIKMNPWLDTPSITKPHNELLKKKESIYEYKNHV